MNILPSHLQPRGRGAVSNASGRYEREARERFDDGWGAHDEAVGQVETELKPIASRTAFSYTRSPDLPFDRTINPYKGCEHGCFYCYARPNHAYLGLSSGLDFETKIFFKPDLVRLLIKEMDNPRYRPGAPMVGGDTDAYQPAERSLRLTRGALETLWAYRNPACIVTKSALVQRDVDILAPMARLGLVKVAISITTLDRKLARAMEPRAATPGRRLETVAALSAAGVPVAVMAAPLIPAINDHELEAILKAAAEAGAREASYVLLRLPHELKTLAREWLAERRPDAAKRTMSLLRQSHGGKDYVSDWSVRGTGTGPYAESIAMRFQAAAKRAGLNRARLKLRTDLFRRPDRSGQLALFDGEEAS
ncbi:MAG: PA0069 family radical SAM protein [Maricaulaceae bacterium]|jgi:DNA repair photolyase